jgi:class 3 adenylate cyclase
VELVGGDVRGIGVHEAARIAAAAGAGEILVSMTTRQLAEGTGLDFEERGPRDLKGLSGARELWAVGESSAPPS